MKKIKSLIIALVLSINVLNINAQTVITSTIVNTPFISFIADTLIPAGFIVYDSNFGKLDTLSPRYGNPYASMYQQTEYNNFLFGTYNINDSFTPDTITTFDLKNTSQNAITFIDTIKCSYDSIKIKTAIYVPNLQYLNSNGGFVIKISNNSVTYTMNISTFANDTVVINHTFKNTLSNKNVISIKLDAKKSTADVMVYDLSGNAIYSNTEARLLGDNEISVNLNAAPGMYLIKADDKVFKMFITK